MAEIGPHIGDYACSSDYAMLRYARYVRDEVRDEVRD